MQARQSLPTGSAVVPPARPKSPWRWIIPVVAIVVICPVALSVILYPIFSQAKLAAKRNLVLTNGKQAALALVMYAGDYDDCLPRPEQWGHGELIYPYTKNEQLLNGFQYAYVGPTTITEIGDPKAEITSYFPGSLAETPDRRVETYVDGHSKWTDNPPPITQGLLSKKWVNATENVEGSEDFTNTWERDITPDGNETDVGSILMKDKGDTDPTHIVVITARGECKYILANDMFTSGAASVGETTFGFGQKTMDKDEFEKLRGAATDKESKAIFDLCEKLYKSLSDGLGGEGKYEVIRCTADTLLLKSVGSGSLSLYRISNNRS